MALRTAKYRAREFEILRCLCIGRILGYRSGVRAGWKKLKCREQAARARRDKPSVLPKGALEISKLTALCAGLKLPTSTGVPDNVLSLSVLRICGPWVAGRKRPEAGIDVVPIPVLGVDVNATVLGFLRGK